MTIAAALGQAVDGEPAELERALDALAGEDPLAQIRQSCELDDAAARVLALLAQIELDESVQATVASTLGVPGAQRATIGLLHRALGPASLAAVAPDGPLARAELLIWPEAGAVFTSTAVGLHPRVAWSALDDRSLDPTLPVGTRTIELDAPLIGDVDLALVHGADPLRRLQTAVTHTAGLAFLVGPEPGSPTEWAALVRQASLLGHAIVLELDGDLSALGKERIERAGHLAWALSSPEPQHLSAVPDRPWREFAAADAPVTDEEFAAVLGDLDLGGRRVTAAQLEHAAIARANLGDPAAAMARLSAGPLGSVLQRRRPIATWDDLVLPPETTARLRELAERYRRRGVVHGDWGLAEYPSPGLVALFTGPSGTGKTLSAEVIAHELGVDLLRVDLQAVVSKYIGETEKNLERIFSAAAAADSVLLFDEADALFSARSKVSDAHDRHANLEVSYLLQRLETHDGFVVLTTNFAGNIDPAFTRRIHASVHFQLPTAEDRERIWARCLAKAPLKDVDLTWAAETFDLSGGSIRNAALAAAFLAATDGDSVEQRHLVGGLVRELVKLGRRPSPELFGPHASRVPDV